MVRRNGCVPCARSLIALLVVCLGVRVSVAEQTNADAATCEPITQDDITSGRLAALANPEEAARRVAALMEVTGDPDYGAYLAGECVSCHVEGNQTPGMGAMDGMDRQKFYQAMVEYRLGLRENEVMRSRSRVLGTDELAALAEHFSSR